MDLTELFFILTICAIILAIILFQFLYFTIKKIQKTDKIILNYEEKYKKIIDVDHEIENRKIDFHLEEVMLQSRIEAMKENLTNLKVNYSKAYEIFDELTQRNQSLHENLREIDLIKERKAQEYDESISFKSRILHPFS